MGFYQNSNITTMELGSPNNSEIVWDDLRVPLTQGKLGTLDKPDFDFTNVGYLFPQNDPTEIIYIILQMPHAWREGSTVVPHIHWRQTVGTAVTWAMDYKWFNLDSAVPGAFTTLTTSSIVFPYTSGSLSQISSFGDLSGSGFLISSLLLIKIYRTDNTTTGDVLAWDFDIHYQLDMVGSRLQFIK